MNRLVGRLRGFVAASHVRLASLVAHSERTILLGLVLVASSISFVIGFVLAHYYSIDVLSSLLIFVPGDCYMDWPTRVGHHCFSDYSITVNIAMVANPWDPYPLYLPPDFKPARFNYTAAGMLPHALFGLLGKWLNSPRLGMFAYLAVLTIAVFTPAIWAARGVKGLDRIVVFVVCALAAVPVWVVLDRGNSIGFIAPIGLVFLVSLCRERWALVAVMVVLAAMVKPQFVVLVVVIGAARQWRAGGLALAGVVLSNLGAYALWPRNFPRTILQSLDNTLAYGGGASRAATVEGSNVSFGKALLTIPDLIKAGKTGGKIPAEFLAQPRAILGYCVLILVVVVVFALGRRTPPVIAGISLLATAALFPALSNPYYLIFVVPIAAVLVRHPSGPPGVGIFDDPETVGDGRRVAGVCVTFAVALSIAQVPLPSAPRLAEQTGTDVVLRLVDTTMSLAPVLWLVVLGTVLVSYARRPASSGIVDDLSEQPRQPTMHRADA